MKLAKNIHRASVVGKDFRSEVRGQRSEVKVTLILMCECYNGGGMHSDGVASRFTRCVLESSPDET